MKIVVNENRQVELINQVGTQYEGDVTHLELEVPEKYNNWNKKIVFVFDNSLEWYLFTDNVYTLTRHITKNNSVKFYIWLTHGETEDFRSVTKTLFFNENVDASGAITEEEETAVNQILALLDAALQEVDNVDIDANKQGTISTVTVTKKDGTNKSVNILDGEKGETGNPGYTPIRGVDYWTIEDKTEILSDINTNLQNYINQPFVSFQIVDGNLIVEVEEWQV